MIDALTSTGAVLSRFFTVVRNRAMTGGIDTLSFAGTPPEAAVAFLLCAVCAGAATVCAWVGPVALASGLGGVCLFIAGLGWAVREVACALSPLEEETAYLQALAAQQMVESHERTKLKIAE